MAWRWPCALIAAASAVLVDALDRRLAGGIDVGDDHRVGVVEAERESVEQRLQAGVAMRLHDRDHLALGRGARGAQHRGDLDGMVAVIVEDRDAVPFAGAGEAPLDAAERGDAPCGSTAIGAFSSCATAIAAVAFSALCRPGIGSARLSI